MLPVPNRFSSVSPPSSRVNRDVTVLCAMLLRRALGGPTRPIVHRHAVLVTRQVLATKHRWSTTARTAPLLRLVSGACELPHPQKRATGGEDAWFICSDTVGVADGVGGWARKGVDSGEYSRTLMNSAHSALVKLKPKDESAIPTPLEVLTYAHRRATCPGSSTACIVQLHDDSIRAINVGDSGFLLCRSSPSEEDPTKVKWQVVYESPHQSHYFNCPFQLGHQNGDLPEHGQLIELDIKQGDLIVLGTDGLFDNLFPEQIASLLDSALPTIEQDGESMEKVASCIAYTAHKSAKGTKSRTPFAVAARKAGYEYAGGKMDDITVVASLVTTSAEL